MILGIRIVRILNIDRIEQPGFTFKENDPQCAPGNKRYLGTFRSRTTLVFIDDGTRRRDVKLGKCVCEISLGKPELFAPITQRCRDQAFQLGYGQV